MKTSHLFFSLALLMTCSLAFAGDKGGNGGGAFICPKTSESEILDLFEARLAGKKIKLSQAPVQKQINDAFARLNPSSTLYKKMIDVLHEVLSSKKIRVPKGFDLAWPRDAANKYAKAGCEAKSIIVFHDDDHSMDFDDSAFGNLPKTQQAALIVHETVYKFLRETRDATDSVLARKIVAELFTDESQDVFLKAIGEIADFYPNAVTRLTEVSIPNFGKIYLYPASYRGETLPPLRGLITLDPSADRRCEPPPPAGTPGAGEWSMLEDNSFTPHYCDATYSVNSSSDVSLHACSPFVRGPSKQVQDWQALRFETPAGPQKNGCLLRAQFSDPYGHTFSEPVPAHEYGLSHPSSLLVPIINFPSKLAARFQPYLPK